MNSAQHRQTVTVRAEASDDDFEDKLSALKANKKATEGTSGFGPAPKANESVSEKKVEVIDYSDEVVYWEGKPAVGDVVTCCSRIYFALAAAHFCSDWPIRVSKVQIHG